MFVFLINIVSYLLVIVNSFFTFLIARWVLRQTRPNDSEYFLTISVL